MRRWAEWKGWSVRCGREGSVCHPGSSCSLCILTTMTEQSLSAGSSTAVSSLVPGNHGPGREPERTLLLEDVGVRCCVSFTKNHSDARLQHCPSVLWTDGLPTCPLVTTCGPEYPAAQISVQRKHCHPLCLWWEFSLPSRPDVQNYVRVSETHAGAQLQSKGSALCLRQPHRLVAGVGRRGLVTKGTPRAACSFQLCLF